MQAKLKVQPTSTSSLSRDPRAVRTNFVAQIVSEVCFRRSIYA
uniref:Uncharacterized protein n=1 Tax=Arundo donax TaxID=35708 RepID=A0A0A9GR05_ARUDO